MIIIKTQDGEILTANSIHPSGNQIVANYKLQEQSDGIGGSITVQNYDFIGEYKSEERVKEVMDMIEKFIIEKHINKMIINMASVTAVNFTQLYDVIKGSGHGNEAIFEMPKE